MSPLTGLPPHLERYATELAVAAAETGLDPLLIAAVLDRESRGGLDLTPPGPSGVGDNGHGHGLMQIDDRSWAQWLATAKWWEPAVNISKGAEILNANFVRFEDAFDQTFCAVAAYNCGPGNVHACLKSLPAWASDGAKRMAIDRRTSDNYASGVLARRNAFLEARTPS